MFVVSKLCCKTSAFKTVKLPGVSGKALNDRASLNKVFGESIPSLHNFISGGGNRRNNNNHSGRWNHFSGDSEQFFVEETVYLLGKKGRRSPSRKPKYSWSWTKILVLTNILVFLMQIATANQLVLMGAKVNEMIAQGQFYRLLTPIFLHGNIAHLLVNCYSLYSLGSTVERCFGSRRFVALYLFSGFLGCVASYFFSKNPSLGASGAIFGLVGGFAVYLKRHQYLLGESSRLGLFSIAQSLLFNVLMSFQRGSRIDNWGHLGGFVGGLLYSYLFGPNLERKRTGLNKVYLQDRPIVKQWISQWRR